MLVVAPPLKTEYVTVWVSMTATLRADECADWTDEELVAWAKRHGIVEEFLIDTRSKVV